MRTTIACVLIINEIPIKNAKKIQHNFDQKIDDTILRLNQEAFEQNAIDEDTEEIPLLP